MGHRINERNIGNYTNDCNLKKRANKLNNYDLLIIKIVLNKVYDCMDLDDSISMYTDGGRFVLGLNGEQMYDLLQAKNKINKHCESLLK